MHQPVEELELGAKDLYPGKGFTAFTDLLQLYGAVPHPRLRDRPQNPIKFSLSERGLDIWNTIRGGETMFFHPYQSFDVVTHFVEEAAKDPKVLAIKMTLYRVSPNSPIAQALGRAAEAGKEVSVLVELQARFDEEANITWARALAEVGAHVVYGLVGYKTHCKVCLEPSLQCRLKEFLELQLADTVKGWWMQSDGSYVRHPQGKSAVRFQEGFYENLQLRTRSDSSTGMPSSIDLINAPAKLLIRRHAH